MEKNVLIKYRTNKYSVEIEKIEVERETEHSVWIKGNRSAKISDWHQHHDTYNDAFNYLNCMYAQKLIAAESKLDRAKNEYAAVQELKK